MSDRYHRPPRLAAWLFEHGVSASHEALKGDLEEEYHDRITTVGWVYAALCYWGQVLRCIPTLLLTDMIWHHIMLKNYVLIALRNLRKYKGFSTINILGLALSMSVCLLIIAMVKDQMGYDSFHTKADRIYRITSEIEESFGRYSNASSPAPLGPVLAAEYEGVEAAVRFRKFAGQAAVLERPIDLQGMYAEAHFFEVFDFELAQGDASTALSDPFSLILTAETASRLFGDVDPMGQVVDLYEVGSFTVTGILKDSPHKSHLMFEALASFSTLSARQTAEQSFALNNWQDSYRYYNYLVLAEGTTPAEVAMLSNELVQQRRADPELPTPVLSLQALLDINFGPSLGNRIGRALPGESIYVFSAFALIQVLIAISNYVGLSVARSLKRAREIGVRKVVGAQRSQIIRQFLSEAVITALVALVVAILFLVWLLPSFNSLLLVDQITEKGISIDLTGDWAIYLLFIGFAVGLGLLAGVYPAFRMSDYLPTIVLKSLTAGKKSTGMRLRKAVTVFQFTVSIVGISITLILYQQFVFILTANHGFDEEQLVHVELQGASYETLRDEMLRHADIAQVAATSCPPAAGCNANTVIQAAGMEKPILMRYYDVDEAFVEQYRLRLLAGRNFSSTYPSDQEAAVILSERALPQLDLGSPEEAIGAAVTLRGRQSTVIGVIEDFYSGGIGQGSVPVMLTHAAAGYAYAVVRLQPRELEKTVAQMEATWKSLMPHLPFRYAFFDEQLAFRHAIIFDVIKVIGFVAGFIVFISCLGLFGMASLTVETRVREVGIRKVLGANVRNVVALLSREYIILILIAIVIATPLAWLLGNLILEDFANRIALTPWVFVAAIAPILGLALLTIGSQTIKAGFTNPVETLRHE